MKPFKNKYLNLLLYVSPFIIAIIIFLVIAVKSGSNMIAPETDKKNDTTYSYCTGLDYHLDSDATSLQKDIFKELNEAIKENDDEKAAETVCKAFVADFFTWTNKAGQYDVGGLYYVYSPNKIYIYNQARDYFYKYLSTYIEEYGNEELLEVQDITTETVSKTDDKYEINSKSFDSYYVRLKWTYANHKFDSTGYLDVVNCLVIKNDDNRFEIVEFYGDF